MLCILEYRWAWELCKQQRSGAATTDIERLLLQFYSLTLYPEDYTGLIFKNIWQANGMSNVSEFLGQRP